MIIQIESPNELLYGVPYRMYMVKDELEAKQIAGEKKGWLYDSHIIKAKYLFILI